MPLRSSPHAPGWSHGALEPARKRRGPLELREQVLGDALGLEERGRRRRGLPDARALAERDAGPRRAAARRGARPARSPGTRGRPRRARTDATWRDRLCRAACSSPGSKLVRQERPHAGHRIREPRRRAGAGRPRAGAARRGPPAAASACSADLDQPRGLQRVARAVEQRERRRHARPARAPRAAASARSRRSRGCARSPRSGPRRSRDRCASSAPCSAAGSRRRARACTPTRPSSATSSSVLSFVPEQAIRVRGIERDLAGAVRRRAARLDAPARDRAAGAAPRAGARRDRRRARRRRDRRRARSGTRPRCASPGASRCGARARVRTARSRSARRAWSRGPRSRRRPSRRRSRSRARRRRSPGRRARARASRRRASRASRPRCARRTRISAPRRLARSKACSGWPSSSSTRFVTSTTTLIERMPADSSRAASHGGRRADLHAAHDAADVAVAAVGILDRDAHVLGRGARALARLGRRNAQRAAEQRAHLARHAEHRHPVAAVRRDLDVEDRLACLQDVGKRALRSSPPGRARGCRSGRRRGRARAPSRSCPRRPRRESWTS